MAEPDVRWHAHPKVATAIKLTAYLLPIVISVVASLWVARRLPTPSSRGELALWWVALSAVALTVATLFERVARRLLPLAVLFQMSLIFPDGAPSRYRLAAKGTSTRTLERDIEEMKSLGDVERSEAAERVLRLVAALSKHDPRTRGHAERVAVFSDMIADELELGEDDRDKLKWAAVLHDVGKLAVHPDILNKPGRPSAEEWETLKSHPVEGARITAPLHEWLGDWSLCIEQHHERWDGKGYPYGLEAEQMAFGARILGVADAYDTITAARSYKKPMPAAKARQELAACAGTQFDPVVVRAFMNISLGKLRWAMGPLAWVAQVPAVRSIPGSAATAATAAAAAATAVIAVGALPTISVADAVITPPPVVTAAPTEAPPVALPDPTPAPTPEPTPTIEPPVIVEGPDGPVLVVPTPEPPTPPVVVPPLPPTPPVVVPPPTPTPTPPPAPTPTPTPTPVVLPGFTPGGNVDADEDAGTITIPGWASAITPGGPGTSFSAVAEDPTLFAVAPTVDPVSGDLTFTLADDVVGSSTVVVTMTDAAFPDAPPASGSFTVTINAVNDEPRFTSGSNVTVAQDSGPATIAAWATDIAAGPEDEADQALTFTLSASDPALFQAGPSLDPVSGNLTFTPAAGASGSASVTVTLTDAGDPSQSASSIFTITITPTPVPANQPPTFTTAGNQTVLEDAGAVVVGGWASGMSPGPASEAGQAVTFTTSTNNDPLFAVLPTVDEVSGDLSFSLTPEANGVATVTVTLTDDGTPVASSSRTFTITVTAVNDAPSFTQNTDPTISDPTVAEDAGPQTVAFWATAISPGPNEGGQAVNFVVTANDTPGLFSAGPAVSSAGTLTFTPADDQAGTATITIELRDDNGTPADLTDDAASPAQTFTITVDPVNDAPSFAQNADPTISDPTVAEDTGAQSIPNWATAISQGSGETGQAVTFAVTGNTNGPLFAALPAVSPTGVLTFTPAADQFGTATITIELRDDGGTPADPTDDATSPAQTFTITVDPVNDEPTFNRGPDQSLVEDAPPQSIAGWALPISAGAANESQTLTFTITTNNDPLFEVLPDIDVATGTLTYDINPSTSGVAFVTVELSDDGGTANPGDDDRSVETFAISVGAVNDPPSFTQNADPSISDPTVAEDAGAQSISDWATAISPGPADEAGQALTFVITGNDTPGLFSAGPAVSSAGVLTFTPAADQFGTATITIELRDDGGTPADLTDDAASPAQTFTVTVDPVNDAPTFTKGADQGALEEAGAQTVAFWADPISAGPGESSQTVSFNVTGNTNPALFSVAPAVSTAGTLTWTPVGNASGTATITLEAQDDGGTADGGVDTSPTQSFVITVTDVNDAPTFAKGADITVDEDSGAYGPTSWATAISAGPTSESSQTVSFNITANTNAGLFAAAPAVNAAGELTFTPAADTFGSATITLNIQDDGGTADGGVDTSATQTFDITVASVNDAPSFTKGADVTLIEDSPAYSEAGWATAISPGPANESTQTVTFDVTTDNDSLFAVLPTVDTTGALSFELAASTLGTATVTVTASDDGGTANGGVDTSAPQTFAITSAPRPKILISEFAWGDMFGAGDDFIEIYNADSVTVDLTGWELHVANEDGSAAGRVEYLFAVGLELDPGEHLLIGESPVIGGVTADYTLAPSTVWPSNDNDPLGIGIWDGTTYIDRVGSRARLANGPIAAAGIVEGLGVPPHPEELPDYLISYERLAGQGDGNCVDTDDNSADFFRNVSGTTTVTPNPQGLADGVEACGVPAGPTSHANSLVISEFRSDGPADNADDFIEVFNPTPATIDVAGWTIDANATWIWPAGSTLAPGEHFLLAGSAWTGASDAVAGGGTGVVAGSDTIQILDGGAAVVDSVNIDVSDGPPALIEIRGNMEQSWERIDGGCTDTGNHLTDFRHIFISTPTTSGSSAPCPNSAPTAVDDAYNATRNLPLTIAAPGLVDNDTDPDADELFVVAGSVSVPANGAVAVNADGSFTYTPDAGFTGDDTFTYLVTDGTATSATPATATITVTPPPPIVISELAWGEMADDGLLFGDDFIEIHNTGSVAYDTTGWELHLTNATSTQVLPLFSGSIPAGGHWLVGESLTVRGVASDQLLLPGLVYPIGGPSDPEIPFGVGIWNGSTYLDIVGTRGKTHNGVVAAALLREGTGLSVLDEQNNYSRSWERRNAGAGNCVDTDDNGADFVLNTTAASVNPQNSSTTTACGVLAVPIAANHLVISEFRHDGPNPGPAGSGSDDFIEIFNPTTRTIITSGWSIQTADRGTIWTWPVAPTSTLAPGESFLLVGPDFPGTAGVDYDVKDGGGVVKGDDSIFLVDNAAAIIDRVVMDSSGEPALPTIGFRQDHSWTRRNGGCTDTDNDAADFEYVGTATPTPSGSFSPCPNSAPTGVADAYSTPADIDLVVPAKGVLDNDTDPDGDDLTLVLASIVGPSNGTLTPAADGSFTYEPNVGYEGPDSFTYVATDGDLNTAATTVSITVTSAPLISEFSYGGLNATGNFVEIHNPNAVAVDVTGWALEVVTSVTTSITLDGPGAVIPAGGYYLVADGALTAVADKALPASAVGDIASQPWGAALKSGGSTIVDQVGNGARPFGPALAASVLVEGTGFPPPAATFVADGYSQSFERRAALGAGNCQDLDDNSLDFTRNILPGGATGNPASFPALTVNPQSSAATPRPCSSIAAPIAANNLVISEFRAEGPDGNQDDFVEIFNPTTTSISLDGLQLIIGPTNSAPDPGTGEFGPGTIAWDFTTDDPGVVLAPGQHYLFVGQFYSGVGTPDANVGPAGPTTSSTVKIYDFPGREIVDEVFIRRIPGATFLLPPASDFTQTWSRRDNGCTDTSPANSPADNFDDFEWTFVPSPQDSSSITPCPNNAPTAVDDPSYVMLRDGTLTVDSLSGVLANDTDPDNDALFVDLTSPGTTPPATLAAFSLAADGSFSYTPPAGFTGIVTFTYQATDGSLEAPTVGTVTIMINAPP